MEKMNGKREGFSSSLAVFFATLGSAVGLGNIWKFPYLTGMYGGGAFLFVYFICIILVGLPIMNSEFFIGRKTKKNAIGAFNALKPNSSWKFIGIFGVITAYLILFFYTCVAGWVYLYVWKSLKGDFWNITADLAGEQFGIAITNPISAIGWQVLVIIVVSIILILGVQKGIEKVTKTLMPLLFLLILICDIRALTLPGAGDGLRFLFQVDFSKIGPTVIITALGLAFFKLSIGMGTMITYSSYFTDKTNLIHTSAKVALSDTLVSLMAGIAIFPAVFSFGLQPETGPGLLFMTIPLVFSKIPLGNILIVLFFLLAAFASTMAMLSMLEVVVAYFSEERGMSRTKAVVLNALIIILFGILAALSSDAGSILGHITIFNKRFFDLFDFISSNILLPINGLFIAIFVGYFMKKQMVEEELSNKNALEIHSLFRMFYFILRYITPILVLIVFLNLTGIGTWLYNLLISILHLK